MQREDPPEGFDEAELQRVLHERLRRRVRESGLQEFLQREFGDDEVLEEDQERRALELQRALQERADLNAPVVFEAARSGRAFELQRLLQERADLNHARTLPGLSFEVSPLSVCMMAGRPESARLLIEAGAQWSDSSVSGAVMETFKSIFHDKPENDYCEGDYVLMLDIILHQLPGVAESIRRLRILEVQVQEVGTVNSLGQNVVPPEHDVSVNMKSVVDYLQEIEAEEGTRMYREREGLVSLLEGQYWHHYDGNNPFFIMASTAHEMFVLLNEGAANNQHGHVDMTRLRCIKPALRRSVMEMLREQLDSSKAFWKVLVAVAKSDDGENLPLAMLSGHESSVLRKVADFLGVRGRALRNAREASGMFNRLATDRVEWEYNPRDGEW